MNLFKRTLAISVTIALGVTAVGIHGLISSIGAPQQPVAVPTVTPMDMAPVLARNTAEWDEFSDHIEAVQRVEVRPPVSGTVTAVHFKDGSIVKKGSALFIISPHPYTAEVVRMQVALTATKSRVVYITSELDRVQKLVANDAIVHRESEEKENATRKAQANLQGATAAPEAARLNPKYTHIVTPVAGRVSCVETTVDSVASVDDIAPILTTLVSVSPMYVAFDVNEQSYLRYSAKAVQGAKTPAYIGLASEGGYTHEGVTQSVDNRLDVCSGTIRVCTTLDNADGRLTPGPHARMHMSTGAPYDATFISDKAISMGQDKEFVLVMDAANKTSYRPVVLGVSVGGLYVVRLGLKAGKCVVVNDVQRVRPGDAMTSNTVTMDSLVTKHVVLSGAQSEAPAVPAEVRADTSAAPAAEIEAKPVNTKTTANAQRLPADHA